MQPTTEPLTAPAGRPTQTAWAKTTMEYLLVTATKSKLEQAWQAIRDAGGGHSVRGIRSLARTVLLQHWDGYLPVDIQQIATALGIVAEGRDDVDHSGHYANGKIIFNKRQPLQQQRFSIAHQIGHHLAGHTLCPEESAQTFSTSASNAIEIQANNFALAVLIPGEHLRYAVLIANQCDLKELALLFGVSTVALHKRLQQIQLI